MTTETQTQFAARLGVANSYVTKLKKAERLVMAGAHRVNVEASLARIAETADPDRRDVAQRNAAARGAPLALGAAGQGAPAGGADERMATDLQSDDDKLDRGYQGAKAVKERYHALTAKAEYQQLVGSLIARDDVDAAMRFIGATINSLLENFPGQNAAIVAPITDVDDVEALLSEACRNVLVNFGEAIERQRAALAERKPA